MMKRLGRMALVGAILLVADAPALAQERQRQLDPARLAALAQMSLLNQKSVQDELKLSEEQVKKVKEWYEARREAFRNFREGSEEDRKKSATKVVASEKAVTESLKPEQLKRLKQIALQRRGTSVLSDFEIATALKLTDAQKMKVKEIQDKRREELRGVRLGDRSEETRKKREELRKSTDEKLLNVLTPEQKMKLKELTGEPFKGEIVRPQLGGNRPSSETRRPGRDR